MTPRISEKQFKENLIKNLNHYHCGWVSGDDEKKYESGDNDKKADVVNHELKVAIEIKDDENFIDNGNKYWSGEFKIKNLSRHLRADIKDASNKFENYQGYKSLVLIRTDKVDWPWALLESAVFGKQDLQKQYDGLEWPSSLFNDTRQNTKNVGGVLFWGRTRSYFIKNNNINVSESRVITYKWVKEVFKNTKEIISTKIPTHY